MLRTVASLPNLIEPTRWLLVAMLILRCHAALAPLPEHSVSSSQQFVIYGGDAFLRGAISRLAERTKSNLLSLLRQPDSWNTVIVINVQTPQANLPEIPLTDIRLSQTGFGVKLQLDLTVGSSVDPSLVERELLRAIVLEMIYRREPNIPAGTICIQSPDWLLDGVLALTPGRDRSELINALAIATSPMSLDEFLHARTISDLDSPARALFRAYSYALVKLLIELPDGRHRLARYINHLSTASNDPFSDLREQFPALRSDSEARWKSKLTEITAARQYELLNFAETEQRLNALLRFDIGGSPSKAVDLGELAQRRKLTGLERAAIAQRSRELLMLTARAHPVLRPLVREYEEITSLLASKKRHRLIQRLANLKVLHDKLVMRMSNIDDFMNWFEATQLSNSSETFSAYLKAADSEESKSKRRDPLSIYLDSLENQF